MGKIGYNVTWALLGSYLYVCIDFHEIREIRENRENRENREWYKYPFIVGWVEENLIDVSGGGTPTALASITLIQS